MNIIDRYTDEVEPVLKNVRNGARILYGGESLPRLAEISCWIEASEIPVLYQLAGDKTAFSLDDYIVVMESVAGMRGRYTAQSGNHELIFLSLKTIGTKENKHAGSAKRVLSRPCP